MTAAEQADTIDLSMASHRGEDHKVSMATFKDLREEAELTVINLAEEANVSLSTVNRMEYGIGDKLSRQIAYQVLNVMSKKIGRRITVEEVEGLEKVVKGP